MATRLGAEDYIYEELADWRSYPKVGVLRRLLMSWWIRKTASMYSIGASIP